MTSTAGRVISGNAGVKINNMDVALVGDKATCNCGLPTCKKVGDITANVPRKISAGAKDFACAGDMVNTGCGMCLLLPSSHHVTLGFMTTPVKFGSGVKMGNGVKINCAPVVGANLNPESQTNNTISSEMPSVISREELGSNVPDLSHNTSSESQDAHQISVPLAPPLPPPLPSMPEESTPKKTRFVIKDDPEIHKQQGAEYVYYSTFSVAMYHLNYTQPEQIKDVEIFIKVWQNLALAVKPTPRNISTEKFHEIKKSIIKINQQWSSYSKPPNIVNEVFRGDSELLAKSYTWLDKFIKSTQLKTNVIRESVDIKMGSPTILSTSTNPKMGYVHKKSILWHFGLERGHGGVVESIYKAEEEITFPIKQPILIKELFYIPQGSAYQNKPDKFGYDHRYVIRAVMRFFK